MFSVRMTTARDFRSDWYAKWKDRFAFPDKLHRKYWELAIVSETLDSHGLLSAGRAGVGFGVGREQLVTAYANSGARIVATDLLPENWRDTHGDLAHLAGRTDIGVRRVDMNWIGGESGYESVDESAFDFSWSVCSMDHCGSVWLTKRFLLNQMNCLRAGGIGVHTAEYSTHPGMPRQGGTVWLGRDDVVDVCDLLRALGHEPAPIDWFCGDTFEDHGIDLPPYDGPDHLKLHIHGGWATCICFAVRKTGPNFWVPASEHDARLAIADVQRSHSHT